MSWNIGDSVSTQRNLILASIFTLSKSVSPSGLWSFCAVLEGHKIQFLIFFHRMLPPTGWIYCGV